MADNPSPFEILTSAADRLQNQWADVATRRRQAQIDISDEATAEANRQLLAQALEERQKQLQFTEILRQQADAAGVGKTTARQAVGVPETQATRTMDLMHGAGQEGANALLEAWGVANGLTPDANTITQVQNSWAQFNIDDATRRQIAQWDRDYRNADLAQRKQMFSVGTLSDLYAQTGAFTPEMQQALAQGGLPALIATANKTPSTRINAIASLYNSMGQVYSAQARMSAESGTGNAELVKLYGEVLTGMGNAAKNLVDAHDKSTSPEVRGAINKQFQALDQARAQIEMALYGKSMLPMVDSPENPQAAQSLFGRILRTFQNPSTGQTMVGIDPNLSLDPEQDTSTVVQPDGLVDERTLAQRMEDAGITNPSLGDLDLDTDLGTGSAGVAQPPAWETTEGEESVNMGNLVRESNTEAGPTGSLRNILNDPLGRRSSGRQNDYRSDLALRLERDGQSDAASVVRFADTFLRGAKGSEEAHKFLLSLDNQPLDKQKDAILNAIRQGKYGYKDPGR